MAKRGKKSTKADKLTEHDWRSIRRILRKVGLAKYIQAGKEEQGRIDLEDFYNYAVSQLKYLEETTWRHQRHSAEVRRLLKKPIPLPELSDKHIVPITREEMARLLVRTHWQKEWGQKNQTTIVRTLVSKLLKGMSKAGH